MSAVTQLAHLAPSFALLELLPLALAAALYARRAGTLARRGRPLARWRPASFAAGLGTVACSLVGLGHAVEERLLAHMGEHVLLAHVATLLLAGGLGGPVLAPLLRTRVVRRLRALTHPAAALALWAANLAAWHVAVLHEAALASGPLHALQHALLVAAGCNAWLALIGPHARPVWYATGARAAYVIALGVPGVVLGNVLLWNGEVLYDGYSAAGALADQSAAGALLLVVGMLATVAPLAVLVIRAAREIEERQELEELAAAGDLALPHRRIQRAVAAGQAQRLRARLRAHEAGDR